MKAWSVIKDYQLEEKGGEKEAVISVNKSRSNQREEIIKKLSIAQKQSMAGEKGLTHAQVMKELRKRLHGK